MSPEERINLVVGHAFGGWHHVFDRKENGKGVQFTFCGGAGTFDFNQLTKLVLACHLVRVRGEIAPHGRGTLRVYLHPREDKAEDWCAHHPDIADLIKMSESLRDRERSLPADSPAPSPTQGGSR